MGLPVVSGSLEHELHKQSSTTVFKFVLRKLGINCFQYMTRYKFHRTSDGYYQVQVSHSFAPFKAYRFAVSLQEGGLQCPAKEIPNGYSFKTGGRW